MIGGLNSDGPMHLIVLKLATGRFVDFCARSEPAPASPEIEGRPSPGPLHFFV
jgi:hypothetical protein